MVYEIVSKLRIPSYYKNTLNEFLEKLHEFLNDIECIALVGSIAREEDFIEGWSDIDILVVVKKRDLINNIKDIAKEINNKYPKTEKGSDILSLWIDDTNNVMKWFGLGCEYYNVIKDFILIYGNDIRSQLHQPSKEELERTLKHFLTEAQKYFDKFRKESPSEKLNTLSLASYIYPLMRFYLCIMGYHTASRKKMIEILKSENKLDLEKDEKEIIATILEDLLARKNRTEPELNRKLIKIIEKILHKMEKISNHNIQYTNH